jgi:hypothetical protein
VPSIEAEVRGVVPASELLPPELSPPSGDDETSGPQAASTSIVAAITRTNRLVRAQGHSIEHRRCYREGLQGATHARGYLSSGGYGPEHKLLGWTNPVQGDVDFVIANDDLAAVRFDAVRLVAQCH